MKRLISLLLAILMAVTSLSLGALCLNAEDVHPDKKLTFVRNGTTVTVSWVAPKDVEGLKDYTVSYSVGGKTKASKTTSATSITLVDIPADAEVKVTVSFNATGKTKTGVVATGSTADIDKDTNSLTFISSTRIVKWEKVDGAYYNVYVDGGTKPYLTTGTPSFDVPKNITEVKVESVVGNKKEIIGSITIGTAGIVVSSYSLYIYKLAGTRTIFWEPVGPKVRYNATMDWKFAGAGSFRETYFDIPEGVQFVMIRATTEQGGSLEVPEYGNFGEGVYTKADTRMVLWYAVDRGVQYDIYLDGSDKPYTMTMLTEFAVPTGHTEISVRYTADGKEHTVGTLKLSETGKFIDDKGTINEPDGISGFEAKSGTSKKIKLSWNAFDGAEKYTIYYRKSSSSKWTKAGATAKCSATISGLSNGTSYDFKIVAGDAESGVVTIKPSTTAQTVKADNEKADNETALPVITSAKQINAYGSVSDVYIVRKDVSLNWSTVKNATKYKVYMTTGDSNVYRQMFSVYETSALVTDLEEGTYKFRITAYVNGTWTKLSDCDYVEVTVE